MTNVCITFWFFFEHSRINSSCISFRCLKLFPICRSLGTFGASGFFEDMIKIPVFFPGRLTYGLIKHQVFSSRNHATRWNPQKPWRSRTAITLSDLGFHSLLELLMNWDNWAEACWVRCLEITKLFSSLLGSKVSPTAASVQTRCPQKSWGVLIRQNILFGRFDSG